jgi:8-oxo-dGTP pyrophosphatase MutT (NUDIX family)
VVLLRDRIGGGVEIFLMRRPAASSFAARALVFPGGSIDSSDASEEILARAPGFNRPAFARRMRLDDNDESRRLCAALCVAAVRETFEESGILIGGNADGTELTEADASRLAAARGECLDGAGLAAVLERHALLMAPQRLSYVAHFVTPASEPRRFDTRFFVTAAPLAQAAAVHFGEAVDGDWYAPSDVLLEHGDDIMRLMPPTRILCHEVARHRTTEGVIADLGSRPVARVLFDLGEVIAGRLPDRIPLPDERHPADDSPAA